MSLSKVRGLQLEMKEFESRSDAWNRKWRNLSTVRCMESGMEEFEPSSDARYRKWRSSTQVTMLGIGNRRVRYKFEGLESGMEELETSLRLGI